MTNINLTLEEKIGQMLCFAFHGTTYNEQLRTLIEDMHIGTVIHFARNVENTKQVYNLNKDIVSHSKIPPFIGIDQEGGMVRRVQSEITYLPGAMALSNSSDDKIYQIYYETAVELKKIGYNLNFMPSVDINNNPYNPVINSRSYSDNKDIVKEKGYIASHAMQDALVLPTPKHFPGHGNTNVDSHIGLPIVKDSIESIHNTELVPYKYLFEKGIEGVMISHILYESIDNENPSTLSKKVITDLLKQELGFKGLIITDSLTMSAIWDRYSISEIVEKGINAGNDIIMFCGKADINEQKEIYHTFIDLVKQGKIKESRIDESVTKILKLKEKYKLDMKPVDFKSDFNKASELSHELTVNSITLFKDNNLLPINNEKVISLFPKINLATLVDNANNNYESIGHYLKCNEVIYSEESEKDFEKIVQKTQKYDKILLATYNVKEGDYQSKLFNMLDKHKTICVALRSPYDYLMLQDVSTYICTFDVSKESIKALVECLQKNKFNKNLPIKIEQRRG